MSAVIIDVAVDVTASLPKLKAAGIKTIGGYMSSINPYGEKCLTPTRVKAIAMAGMSVFLIHEGWGGVNGRGISANDGARDGAFCRSKAPSLGAPKGSGIYFACDTDFDLPDIRTLVLPYFKSIRAAFGDRFYRVGVYGSGAVCAVVMSMQLADLSFISGSKGWMGYSAWVTKADIVQTVDANIGGISDDADVAKDADFGQYTPTFQEAA